MYVIISKVNPRNLTGEQGERSVNVSKIDVDSYTLNTSVNTDDESVLEDVLSKIVDDGDSIVQVLWKPT